MKIHAKIHIKSLKDYLALNHYDQHLDDCLRACVECSESVLPALKNEAAK